MSPFGDPEPLQDASKLTDLLKQLLVCNSPFHTLNSVKKAD